MDAIGEQVSASTSDESIAAERQARVDVTIQAWREDATLAPFVSAMSAIVAPLGSGSPVGAALRYHPVFGEIKLARVADDPSLPQGEWIKSRKKADWGKVQALCQRALGESGKDYQVGAWLCEGWFHVSGVAGLRAGVMVMRALVSHYWRDGFPEIAPDDCDARFNVFAWLDEAVARLLRHELSVCPSLGGAITSDGGDEAAHANGAALDLTPARWSDVIAGKAGVGVPDAATWRAKADPARIDALHDLHAQLTTFAAQWHALRDALDVGVARHADRETRMQVPTLRQGDRAIEAALQAIQGLIDGRPASRRASSAGMPDGDMTGSDAAEETRVETSPDSANEGAGVSGRSIRGAGPGVTFQDAQIEWRRVDAYRALAEIAAFLRQAEPHSPVPYLIEKAVGWENAPLDQIMGEVFRSDAAMRQYAALIGVAVEATSA
ncbi:type VI secretion system protein TssA [Robbsia sp. KACC 23696]|uniref:type VI secretion system protein TssA n=1 Tax=Robbsia sp. KACC 23696 TaxID=3149231 RepID=UPI00325C0820